MLFRSLRGDEGPLGESGGWGVFLILENLATRYRVKRPFSRKLRIDPSLLTDGRVPRDLERFAADRALLCRMAERARSLARPNATDELARACLVAGGLAA